jgi:hypothetical protein
MYSHPEQPGRLADDPDIKPRHFADVMSTDDIDLLHGSPKDQTVHSQKVDKTSVRYMAWKSASRKGRPYGI